MTARKNTFRVGYFKLAALILGGKMSDHDITWLAEPHMQALFMQFPLPMVIVGREGHIQQFNACFNETFGVGWLESVDWDTLLQKIVEGAREPITFRCDHCAEEVFVRTVSMTDGVILVIEKSTNHAYQKELRALHQRVQELEKISVSDRLTGAWNRVHFDRTVAIEMGRSARYRQPLSLIFFDIDHFKHVNDTFGHAVGDQVLCELVKTVNANIRISDMLFRWGGEEFVILATATPYRSAGVSAETLRQKVAQQPMTGVGHITISLGVAEYVAGESETCWFKRADAALYEAKNTGRNRIIIDPHNSSDAWTSTENTAVLRLAWRDAYCCGHPVIDEEHQHLFDLANALINATFARGEYPQVFNDALAELLAHVSKHFASEEAILAEYHYPDLAVHIHAHHKLIEHALQLRDRALAGGVTMGELVDFLADEVVARHLLKTDREFYGLFSHLPTA